MKAKGRFTTYRLCGDGKQGRDIRFVEDLVDAFERARQHLPQVQSQALQHQRRRGQYGAFAGAARPYRLVPRRGRPAHLQPWRVGDQHYSVSDIAKFQQAPAGAPGTVGARA